MLQYFPLSSAYSPTRTALSGCGNSSSTAGAPAANPAVAPLTAAKGSLDTAKSALAAATTKDHGGYVEEKARTQVNHAMTNLAAAAVNDTPSAAH